MQSRNAKFGIGQVVKHRFYPFRGVIFDVDPVFANTEEWWRSIPAEVRPPRNSRSIISTPRTRTASTSPMSPSRICVGRIRRAGPASAGQRDLRADGGRQILRPRPLAPELKTARLGQPRRACAATASGLPRSREA